jgi:hypothetical protein
MHEHNATPHLIEAMQWVACLSRSEAEFALRDYRTGRDEPARSDLMQWAGGEAVWSYQAPGDGATLQPAGCVMPYLYALQVLLIFGVATIALGFGWWAMADHC